MAKCDRSSVSCRRAEGVIAVLANPALVARKAQDQAPAFAPRGRHTELYLKWGKHVRGSPEVRCLRTASLCLLSCASFFPAQNSYDADSKRLDACARRYVTRPYQFNHVGDGPTSVSSTPWKMGRFRSASRRDDCLADVLLLQALL